MYSFSNNIKKTCEKFAKEKKDDKELVDEYKKN